MFGTNLCLKYQADACLKMYHERLFGKQIFEVLYGRPNPL